MTKNKLSILTFAILLSVFLLTPACASWSPWEEEEKAVNKKEEIITSVPEISALALIRFYQGYISPLLRKDKCNFTPSCSNYSVQAIKEFGAAKGGIMTFERLLRDHPWAWEESYKVKSRRLYDPPSRNDYW